LRFGLTTFILLITQAVPRVYPSAPSLSQAFGAYKKSGMNLGMNHQTSGVVRGGTRVEWGHNFPGAA